MARNAELYNMITQIKAEVAILETKLTSEQGKLSGIEKSIT